MTMMGTYVYTHNTTANKKGAITVCYAPLIEKENKDERKNTRVLSCKLDNFRLLLQINWENKVTIYCLKKWKIADTQKGRQCGRRPSGILMADATR